MLIYPVPAVPVGVNSVYNAAGFIPIQLNMLACLLARAVRRRGPRWEPDLIDLERCAVCCCRSVPGVIISTTF